jgi:hypothetical protein
MMQRTMFVTLISAEQVRWRSNLPSCQALGGRTFSGGRVQCVPIREVMYPGIGHCFCRLKCSLQPMLRALQRFCKIVVL